MTARTQAAVALAFHAIDAADEAGKRSLEGIKRTREQLAFELRVTQEMRQALSRARLDLLEALNGEAPPATRHENWQTCPCGRCAHLRRGIISRKWEAAGLEPELAIATTERLLARSAAATGTAGVSPALPTGARAGETPAVHSYIAAELEAEQLAAERRKRPWWRAVVDVFARCLVA